MSGRLRFYVVIRYILLTCYLPLSIYLESDRVLPFEVGMLPRHAKRSRPPKNKSRTSGGNPNPSPNNQSDGDAPLITPPLANPLPPIHQSSKISPLVTSSTSELNTAIHQAMFNIVPGIVAWTIQAMLSGNSIPGGSQSTPQITPLMTSGTTINLVHTQMGLHMWFKEFNKRKHKCDTPASKPSGSLSSSLFKRPRPKPTGQGRQSKFRSSQSLSSSRKNSFGSFSAI